jgi:3-hydroxyacyl-CoA dehydrogenase
MAPRSIETISVIGAGVMGQGIAIANLKHDIPVLITDSSQAVLDEAVARIVHEMSRAGGGASTASESSLPPLTGTLDDKQLVGADLVLETVVESLPVKKRVLKRLESILDDRTILASNTSSIPISRIATCLEHRGRFCGMHFCHPVAQRRLIEVVPGDDTDEETVAAVMSYAESIGKLPIAVKDRPGFLVNRLLCPYMREAVALLLDGVPATVVEQAAVAFGMPMGPLEKIDSIGIDVALRTARTLRGTSTERSPPTELMIDIYAQGRFGRKSGSGFFVYKDTDDQAPGQMHPDVEALVAQRMTQASRPSDEEVAMRLFLPMLTEATRVGEDGVVSRISDIDSALIHGVGFPEGKGGILRWADDLGISTVVQWLRRLEPLGTNYQPTRTLLDMAAAGTRFYPD